MPVTGPVKLRGRVPSRLAVEGDVSLVQEGGKPTGREGRREGEGVQCEETELAEVAVRGQGRSPCRATGAPAADSDLALI